MRLPTTRRLNNRRAANVELCILPQNFVVRSRGYEYRTHCALVTAGIIDFNFQRRKIIRNLAALIRSQEDLDPVPTAFPVELYNRFRRASACSAWSRELTSRQHRCSRQRRDCCTAVRINPTCHPNHHRCTATPDTLDRPISVVAPILSPTPSYCCSPFPIFDFDSIATKLRSLDFAFLPAVMLFAPLKTDLRKTGGTIEFSSIGSPAAAERRRLLELLTTTGGRSCMKNSMKGLTSVGETRVSRSVWSCE